MANYANADTQALSLLYNTLASGTYASQKAVIPQPEYFALAGTLLVHPTTTTRPKSADHKEAANVALRFLRLASTLVSPRDAMLNRAFSFGHSRISRSGRHIRAEDDENATNPSGEKVKFGKLDVANEASLWSRAEDFWHVVGWAFNCSVLHPERWEYWHLWLQFMCGILEDDWDEREQEYKEVQKTREAEQQHVPEDGDADRQPNDDEMRKQDLKIFRESMIYQYISADATHGRNRRIIRAIFADGSSTSVNEFRQVFDKELLLPKSDKQDAKPKKRDRDVNIDKEQYGDYLSEDESDEDDQTATHPSKPSSRSTSPPAGGMKLRRTKRTRRGTRNATDPLSTQSVGPSSATNQNHLTHHNGGVSPMGGLESLALRKRLLSMISKVSERIPSHFMPVYHLYHLFVENIRPLPLPIFQAFVSPYVLPELTDAQQSTLCELLLFCMRESSAPNTDEEYLNQDKLERCFLPFAATTASVVDNAKVSILLEALIILLAKDEKDKMLSVTPAFKEAVEKGILHRADRAMDELRRSQASREKEPFEWCWLVESGDRLNYLVELLSLQDSEPTEKA